MKELANVEYFYNKCNEVLNTDYSSSDWEEKNTNKAINIEWLSIVVPQVYKKIHNPKDDCRLHLSTRFNYSVSKVAVPIEVVNSIVNYLSGFNKPCDTDCACYRDRNCNCVCNSNSTCNCNCNCACECGSDTECQCDCEPYDCNCDIVKNCNYGSQRPMIQNCACYCDCPPPACPPIDSGDGSITSPYHPQHNYCEQCCPESSQGYRLSSRSHSGGWLTGCNYDCGSGSVGGFCGGGYQISIPNCPSAWWCCGKPF